MHLYSAFWVQISLLKALYKGALLPSNHPVKGSNLCGAAYIARPTTRFSSENNRHHIHI